MFLSKLTCELCTCLAIFKMIETKRWCQWEARSTAENQRECSHPPSTLLRSHFHLTTPKVSFSNRSEPILPFLLFSIPIWSQLSPHSSNRFHLILLEDRFAMTVCWLSSILLHLRPFFTGSLTQMAFQSLERRNNYQESCIMAVRHNKDQEVDERFWFAREVGSIWDWIRRRMENIFRDSRNLTLEKKVDLKSTLKESLRCSSRRILLNTDVWQHKMANATRRREQVRR